MIKSGQSRFTLSTGTDLAFALVVFISFFTAFSTSEISNLFLITVIVFLGIAYVSNGIYGFSYAKKANTSLVKSVYFVLQLLIGGLIIYYGHGAGFSALILLPVVAHTAMLLDSDWSLLANGGIFLTFILSVWSYSHNIGQVWQSLPLFFVGQVFILIFTQMAFTEQKAREKLEILAQELAEANKHLSEYAEKVHDLAVTRERNRFAREIHDGLGHYLTTINMQLSAAIAKSKVDPKETLHMLENAKKLSAEALVDVRNSVYALRKDAFGIEDIATRVQRIVKAVETSDRNVNFQVLGTPRDISPQIDLTLFRAAQEMINNAQKHSKASNIEVTLDFTASKHIQISVADNGLGSDNIEYGYGLIGIDERVNLLDGNVDIETSSGKGFVIRLRLPG